MVAVSVGGYQWGVASFLVLRVNVIREPGCLEKWLVGDRGSGKLDYTGERGAQLCLRH